MCSTVDHSETAAAWEQAAPLLDQAMGMLSEPDRNAIVLRFLENKSLGDVGQALGVNEGAAKMRVARALEKLRKRFGKKNMVCSAALLAEMLAAHSTQAAPPGLTAATVSALHAPMAGASTTALVNVTLKIMSATKTKILLGALLVMLLLTTAVTSWFFVSYLPSRPSVKPLSFAGLRESEIPGRYKWSEGPTEFFIVLYDDHTFMNKDGTTFPMYRWDLTPAGLSITWQRNTSVFTNIEAPGVYTAPNPNRLPVRLEKLPAYTARVPPAPIASLVFGNASKTNGLIPVPPVGGESELLPGMVDGVDCHRLMRAAGRVDGVLSLSIAPELKDPPFTNALLIVEFFDRAATAPGSRPGRLVIQYDDESSPFANSEPLRMSRNQTWQEATFYIPTPLFQNHQPGGGDLRLVSSRSELPVRSIRLVKNADLPETKMPSLSRR